MLQNNQDKKLFKPTLTQQLLDIISAIGEGVWGTNVYVRRNNMYDSYKEFCVKSQERIDEQRERHRINAMMFKLKKSNLIIEEKDGKLKLTPKGWLKLLSYDLFYKRFNKSKSKSNELFFIIFDIPERLKKARNLFRKALYSLGFDYVQKSIFITHNEKAFKVAQKIVINCDLKQFVKFIEAKRMF